MIKKKFNVSKKKIKILKKKLVLGNLYIKSNLKNTILSLTKLNGDLLKQWSTKSLKKTKFKKNTPYNVQLITYKMNQFINIKKIKKINVYLNGTGVGRYNVLRNLKSKKLKVGYVFDKTPLPFNGCRKKKTKRR